MLVISRHPRTSDAETPSSFNREASFRDACWRVLFVWMGLQGSEGDLMGEAMVGGSTGVYREFRGAGHGEKRRLRCWCGGPCC
jgi:hypothetical protein